MYLFIGSQVIDSSPRTEQGFVDLPENYLNHGGDFVVPVIDHSTSHDSDHEFESKFTSNEGAEVRFRSEQFFIRPNQIKEFETFP